MRRLAATTSRPNRYRNKSAFARFGTAFLIFWLAWGTWLIWSGATWSYSKSKAPVVNFTGVFSLVLGVFVASLGLLGLFGVLRTPVILTSETLRMWKGFRRRISIPVQEVTGVGLVFRILQGGTGALPGWCLMIWPSDGHPLYTGIGYFPMAFRRGKRGGGKRRSLSAAKFDPVADTDTQRLASTHAARTARSIYDHVIAQQGPSGALATQQMQKHGHASGPWGASRILAWWSPDETMGSAGSSGADPSRIK